MEEQQLEPVEWPLWVSYAQLALVFSTLAFAVYQRRGVYIVVARSRNYVGHVPLGMSVAFAALALAPFLLDSLAFFRTGLPRWCATALLWFYPVAVLTGVGFFVFHPSTIDFAPFVLVFLSAGLASRTPNPVAIITPLASIALMVTAEATGYFQGSFIWVMGITFGWGGGAIVGLVVKKNEELQRAQAALMDKAATEERSRIAREVHDVIAHSMSVTMLHITAARMALEKQKPDEALDALQEAERQGRSSMSDIRRTVGLLGPDANAAAPPLPVAADIPKLVTDFQNAGLDVELRIDGDIGSVQPAAGLSLYRIVQESLTNVAKHAPGATTVVRLTVDDKIRLAVTNDKGNGNGASSDGNGLGVRGMIERAATIDGELEAGPHDGGWAVALTAPR